MLGSLKEEVGSYHFDDVESVDIVCSWLQKRLASFFGDHIKTFIVVKKCVNNRGVYIEK